MSSLVVIGLGLIGGSIAKKCRELQIFTQVIGIDNNPETGKFALQNGVIDVLSDDLQVCQNADLIILATPIFAIKRFLMQLKDINTKAIISDVGSVKQPIIESAKVLGDKFANFVPAHPIAGSEKSGIYAVNSDLFVNHQVILTPDDTEVRAVGIISEFWKKLGAKVEWMSAQQHDEIFAATSHLPHLLAFALVDSLANNDSSLDIFNHAAGGFRDFTRIAASDAQMWHDIFLDNKQSLLAALEMFTADLSRLKEALIAEDSNFLLSCMTNAQTARNHFAQILQARNKSE